MIEKYDITLSIETPDDIEQIVSQLKSEIMQGKRFKTFAWGDSFKLLEITHKEVTKDE